MPRIVILSLVLFNVIVCFAQHDLLVVSSENKEPIPFATVFVYTHEKLLFQAQTSDRGMVHLPLEVLTEEQTRFLAIRSYGYEDYRDTLRFDFPKTYHLQPLIKLADEVVITGQLTPTTTDKSLHTIRILDRKAIEAKGSVNLRDVLQNEMGMRVSQDQVLGSGLSLQGMGSENIQILMDGVPLIGRLDGNIDLSQINLNNIERIEIVEGPLSVAYGSSALGGTINLITKKNAKPGFTFQGNSFYETVGNYNADGRIAYRNKNHQIAITGGRNYFDGWSNNDPKLEFPQKKIADSSRFHSWKPKEQYFAGFQYSWLYKRTKWMPVADYFQEKMINRGLPRTPYFNTALDDVYQTIRHNQGIQFQGYHKDRFQFQGVIAHNYFERIKNTYFIQLNTLDQHLTPTSGDQDTTVFRTFMSRSTFSKSKKNDKFNYELGYDVRFDFGEGARIAEKKQRMDDYAFFGSLEWKPNEKLAIKPGIRTAFNSIYKGSFVPSLHAKWNGKKTTWRWSYAQGFRAPSMKELYLEFVDINHNILGNVNLKPEQSHHTQLSWSTTRKKAKRNSSFEIQTFYQYVTNRISLSQDQTGTLYSYFNIDHFENTGIQARWNGEIKQIRFQFGANYVGIRTNYSQNNQFAFSPELVANTTYTHPKTAIQFAVFYKYTGKTIRQLQYEDGSILESRMEDYHLLDATIQREFWKKKITLALGARNLMNVSNVLSSNSSNGAHSAGGSSTPVAWGRTFFIRFNFLIEITKKQ